MVNNNINMSLNNGRSINAGNFNAGASQFYNNLTTDQKLEVSSSINVRGEEFVILPVSGSNPIFNNRASTPTLQPGTKNFKAYKKDESKTEEIEDAAVHVLMSSLFPLAGILEHLKHIADGVKHWTEDRGVFLDLTRTVNLDPRIASRPDLAFMPNTLNKNLLNLNANDEDEEKKKKQKAEQVREGTVRKNKKGI